MHPKNKWAFCPMKRCGRCGRDISNDAELNGDYITGCPFCHWSFLE